MTKWEAVISGEGPQSAAGSTIIAVLRARTIVSKGRKLTQAFQGYDAMEMQPDLCWQGIFPCAETEELPMRINFFRTVAWTLLISIVVMTVVPPALRVVTGAPHNVEHAVIFFVTGVAFGLGYELRISIIFTAAVVFCAFLEIVQLAVPGRHARVSDFLIDAGAACMGIAIAWAIRRLSEGFTFREAAVRVRLQHDVNGLTQISDTDPTRYDKRNKVHHNGQSGLRSSARASIQASTSDPLVASPTLPIAQLTARVRTGTKEALVAHDQKWPPRSEGRVDGVDRCRCEG
jgi:VanZ family protein